MGRIENLSVSISKAFARSVKFALERADFELAEGERYLVLAFERDCGVEYGLIARRLNQLGEFDAERAGRAAVNAFFGQRPSVLASLARDWPKEVACQRADGLDLCKLGLAMAVATGRSDAAMNLVGAMGHQPQAGERLGAALIIANELSNPQIQSVISWASPEESAERKKLVEQIIAECERSAIDADIPSAPKSNRGAKAL